MTEINEIQKFNNFLGAMSKQQQGDDLYDIDLETTLEGGNVHALDGTVFSDCGCVSGVFTGCGTCA